MSLKRERNDEKETEFVNRELFAANRHSLSQEEVFMERESGFYYLPLELVIHIWKFLDAHTVDTILTRTCRLWNQLVAENGSRLPAQQFAKVKIVNWWEMRKTIELLLKRTCDYRAFPITSFYDTDNDFLRLHQHLNRISQVYDLELRFYGQNAQGILRAVSEVARNHWKPRRLSINGNLHTGDGDILKAAMLNLSTVENLKCLKMDIETDFGGFGVTPFLTKRLKHIATNRGDDSAYSINLITDDVFVSMLHEETWKTYYDGGSITVAGPKGFLDVYAKVLLRYNNAQ